LINAVGKKEKEKTIIIDLVPLRGDVVDAEIVKRQRRSLWTEEQSLEARHVYQNRNDFTQNELLLSMHGEAFGYLYRGI
jgi:hypothetical protein